MARVTEADEGRTGAITRYTGSVVGKVVRVYLKAFMFQIDGTEVNNVFQISDWNWVPDPEPLPTAPGSVIALPSASGDPAYYMRTGLGGGYWVSERGVRYSDKELRSSGYQITVISDRGEESKS